jgi:hypothetical protein
MLTGETSPGRYGQMFRAMRDCLPGSVGEPTVIPRAAHGMNRDNPQAFNAAVLGFLSGRLLVEAFPFLARHVISLPRTDRFGAKSIGRWDQRDQSRLTRRGLSPRRFCCATLRLSARCTRW